MHVQVLTIVTVSPERILDTRDPNNVGLDLPFTSVDSRKLQVTGSIPTATGTKTVVPTGATGVLLNVTPVNASAAGFVSIRPGDATGAATTSSLNFTAGGILPNAVQVAVPTEGANAGKIDITFNAYGVAGPTTDLLIDVVGYMTIPGFLSQGEIVKSQGASFEDFMDLDDFTVDNYGGVSLFSGDEGAAQAALEGPESIGGVPYGLKSVTYCLADVEAPAYLDGVAVMARFAQDDDFWAGDLTNRTEPGCYTLDVNDSTSDSYVFVVLSNGGLPDGTGDFWITSITSTWAPASTLPAPSPSDTPPEFDIGPPE